MLRERREDLAGAEEVLERAVAIDPSRAAAWERLAELLGRQTGRGRDAEIAWEHADQAGSREALFALARIASGGGRSSRAAALYRRYLAEAAGGVHAEEAQAGLEREERRQGTLRGAAFGIRRVRSSCRRPLVGEAAHGPHARGVAEARSRRDA